MRKTTKILTILSLILIGNTLSRPEQKNDFEIRMSIDKIDEDLQSPFAKAGLELTVWNFYRARVALSPNGYESTDEFKGGFLQSYLVFKKCLWAGDFKGLKSRIGDSYLNEMDKSYNQNREKYLDFIRSLAKTPYFPPNYSSDFIVQSQAYFSLILFDAQKDEWAKAKKITYIWPICR